MNTMSMQRISVIKRIVLYCLILFVVVSSSFITVYAQETEITFTDAEYALSNNTEQGKNSWYYCYGHADGKYFFLDYSTEEKRWCTNDTTEPFIHLYENGAHPGGSYDAIKLWVATADGTADIGLKAHLAPSGATDGVVVSVIFKSKDTGEVTTFGKKTLKADDSGVISKGSVNIKRGDIVYFVVNCSGNNSNDGTDFYTAVRFTKTADGTGDVDPGNKRVVDWLSYYSDVQGENDWYYCYGTPQKYMYLTYGYMNNSTEVGWRAGHDDWYQQITADRMHPGCYRWSTLRVWVAKQDGIISLEGDIIKRVNDGDGVDVTIWFNDTKMIEKHFEADDLTPYSVDNMENLAVKKGDTIILELNAGKNYNSRNDYTAFCVEIFWESKGDNFDAQEDYTKYLNIVEREADIIGVIEVQKKQGDFNKTK